MRSDNRRLNGLTQAYFIYSQNFSIGYHFRTTVYREDLQSFFQFYYWNKKNICMLKWVHCYTLSGNKEYKSVWISGASIHVYLVWPISTWYWSMFIILQSVTGAVTPAMVQDPTTAPSVWTVLSLGTGPVSRHVGTAYYENRGECRGKS